MKVFLYPLTAFILSLILTKVIIRLSNTFKWYDRTGGRKIHTGNIPRLGGVGFVIPFIGITAVFFLTSGLKFIRFLPLLIGSSIIFVFGVLDDFIGLRPKLKMLIQMSAAGIVTAAGFSFSVLGPWQLGYSGPVISFLWILGCINAFNLIDGMDALCGGLTVIILAAYAFICASFSLHFVIVVLILIASIAGFLVYNKPTAKVFMGDGGSQYLGYVIAVIPLLDFPSYIEYNKILLAGVLTSIPVFDTLAAVWRRTRERRSFFTADKAHIHHKLMNMGYRVKGILLILYAIQFFLCAIAVIAVCSESIRGTVILGIGLCAMSLFFSLIHFTNRAVIAKEKSTPPPPPPRT
ncbi:MraY family glycosyltransferase [Treponema sp. HNW]|uniref:glycosyltransferase family 4 protein n=1 Tax=Treponema sp. HNW TaxID=3116654 RepID=UPI003D0BB481